MNSKPDVSAGEALKRLIEGNERFLRGESRVAGLSREAMAAMARGQRPFATILGCSDSRVTPELPVLDGLNPELPPPEQLARAVESNVRSTVGRILESTEGEARVAEGRVKCVGAIYDIETGRVRFLEAPDQASG